ncbi:MAG TPA: nucleotidyltransferase family protein [Desulfosporosinus sp.]|nr:nucleotidyltransferase family protein [Desulfosporosinus sp.]
MVRFVVMAAGLATRMGQDKLVMPWKDSTVLGYVLQTLIEAIEVQEALTEICVVARHPIESYATKESRDKFMACGGIWLRAPSPKPLAETIRVGLQDLSSEVQMIGFLPGDQVGVTAQGLASCLRQVQRILPDFLVPIAGDMTGSPVFFHRRYVPELMTLQGEQGGREVLNRYPELWSKYRVEESLFQDVDTPEQYQALLSQNI